MSKSSKTAASNKRASLKRSQKAQQKALYEGFKARGANTKKKGSRNAAGTTTRTKRHLIGNCGNVGCSRASCYPQLAKQKMNDSNDPRVRFRTTEQQRKDGLF
jgi:hypothetical protein